MQVMQQSEETDYKYMRNWHGAWEEFTKVSTNRCFKEERDVNNVQRSQGEREGMNVQEDKGERKEQALGWRRGSDICRRIT